MVHDLGNIEGRFCLTHYISHHRIGDELSEFRSKIWDDFSFFTIPHLRIRIVPPCFYDSIFQCRPTFSLEVIIGEESYEIGDGSSLRIIHERETTIAEVVLDTRTKYLISKKFDHDIGRVSDNHLFLIFAIGLKEIESHRTCKIPWIEVDKILCTFLGYEIH